MNELLISFIRYYREAYAQGAFSSIGETVYLCCEAISGLPLEHFTKFLYSIDSESSEFDYAIPRFSDIDAHITLMRMLDAKYENSASNDFEATIRLLQNFNPKGVQI